jgi:hypothetical protein
LRKTLAILGVTSLWSARGLAEAPALHWAEDTASPRPDVQLGAREQMLLSRCDESDAVLRGVAAQIADKRLATDDVDSITYALRVAGEPHVWPRALVLRGSHIEGR